MTADARRDEALRLIGEAIAVCEAATEGTWRVVSVGKRADIRTEQELGWDHRGTAVVTAADSEFGAVRTLVDAEHIAYHDPQRMLKFHRMARELLEEHDYDAVERGCLTCTVNIGADMEVLVAAPWPCPTAERVIAAYTGEGE